MRNLVLLSACSRAPAGRRSSLVWFTARTPAIVAEVTPQEGQVKLGSVQGFTVLCDESSHAALGQSVERSSAALRMHIMDVWAELLGSNAMG
jgi:hypothetical protein